MRHGLLLAAALIAFGCNGDDRDTQAISAGLSAGAGGESSDTDADASPQSDPSTTASGTSGGSDGPASSSGPDETSGGGSESTTTQGNDDTTGGETTTGVGESSSGGESDSSGVVDGVLEIGIIAHNDCTFTVEPPSITVPEGTEFTVNWVSSPASEVEFDIAKIDPFNHVPIVIGMEPGSAYHDEVREWCGTLFTGTFDFRLTSCFDPLYIPVDCGG